MNRQTAKFVAFLFGVFLVISISAIMLLGWFELIFLTAVIYIAVEWAFRLGWPEED